MFHARYRGTIVVSMHRELKAFWLAVACCGLYNKTRLLAHAPQVKMSRVSHRNWLPVLRATTRNQYITHSPARAWLIDSEAFCPNADPCPDDAPSCSVCQAGLASTVDSTESTISEHRLMPINTCTQQCTVSSMSLQPSRPV